MAQNLNLEVLMDKIQIFGILMLVCIFLRCFTQWLAKREKRIESKRRSLVEQWQTARNTRIAWEETHCYQNPWAWFLDPEYQILWDIEIGVEELCVLYSKDVRISLPDYEVKKKAAESDKIF